MKVDNYYEAGWVAAMRLLLRRTACTEQSEVFIVL